MSGHQHHDAVIVGAGPAGLAAATVLARGGADVLVVDEQPTPGGQIYRAIEQNARRTDRGFLGPDYFHGRGLVTEFRASTATYLPRTSVVGIAANRTLWLQSEGRLRTVSGTQVLLATGAMERPVPVPGWTLPGVITAGAAQIMLKREGLVPSEPMALVGTGPLFYLLAWQCIEARANIAAIIDTGARANWRRAAANLPAALTGKGPSYLLKGAKLMQALLRSGVPRYGNVDELRIEGDSQVCAIAFRQGKRQFRLPVGIVALHEGVIPAQQLTRAAGCTHEWDETQQAFRPVRDTWGHSSVDGLLVAGDAGGISGARGAEYEGRIAASQMLHRLGRIEAGERDELAAVSRRELARHQSVRPFLDRLYQPRPEILAPAGDTIVCRCEEVAAGAVRDLASKGLGPNQVKSALRCGMGPCQGRLCGPTVAKLVADCREAAPEAVGYYTIRSPLKPVPLAAFADLEDASGGAP